MEDSEENIHVDIGAEGVKAYFLATSFKTHFFLKTKLGDRTVVGKTLT